MSFNSREYEFSDTTVIVGGKDLLGLRGVEYTEKVEREVVYGKGGKPKAIQSGNFSYEGNVTMLQSDYEALVVAGKGSVLSLSIDISCTYGNPPDILKTDRMVGCRFTEAKKGTKQGDKFQEITLPFICLDIQQNV
jgi:hypothetical protein